MYTQTYALLLLLITIQRFRDYNIYMTVVQTQVKSAVLRHLTWSVFVRHYFIKYTLTSFELIRGWVNSFRKLIDVH